MIQNLVNNFSPERYAIPWLVVSFLLAFLIAFQTFPTILYVAKQKQLMDEPNSHSVHSNGTPTLGGIGIFLGLVVMITLVGAFLNTKILLLVMGGLTILFFLGLKDDLTVLSVKKKFLGQLFACGLLILFTDTRIIGFSKILDIDTLPYWISVLLTLFVYILIINAFNLIDGIDGLAGSIALSTSAIFCFLFYKDGDLSLATVAVALCGTIIPFLRLNFSSRQKIFMGDTGSMILGFLIAVFTVSFINKAQINMESSYFKSAPALAFAMLFYPLIDTLRIFFIRVFILKKSPFKADKNHIHHRFIQVGFSHLETTLLITSINILIIVIAFSLTSLNLNNQIFSMIVYGSVLFSIPIIIKKIIMNKAQVMS